MKIINGKRKELEIKAAQLIAKKINSLLKIQERVVLAIPGGRSIIGVLNILKNENIKWDKVHIFMIDDTIGNDPGKNFKQAYDIFLEYLTKQKLLLSNNMHPYIYFNLPMNKGLEAYKNELKLISDCYDIILLSSGEDGHVGSLFPNSSVKDPSEFFVNVKESPKLPSDRISASRRLLQKSKCGLLLFFGEEKREAYENFMNNKLIIADCPAKLINSIEDSYVFTDVKNL
ncbi:MAG: 6-phosphogluconolactonase [Nanoarchaeota archaeon]